MKSTCSVTLLLMLSTVFLFLPFSFSQEQETQQWNLPVGAKARLGKGIINEVVYNPNDHHLAVASTIGIWIYDSDTGEELQLLTDHIGENCISFAPNGMILASGSHDGLVRIWNVETGKLLNKFTGHTDSVNSTSFSPDGQMIVSGSYDNAVILWDVSSGNVIQKFVVHENSVGTVAFSPDGSMIASGSQDDTIRLWNVESGNLIYTLTGNSYGIRSIAFSPDGKTIASAGGNTVRLWDVVTGEEKQLLGRFPGNAHSVAFSANGQLATAVDWDGTVILWDTAIVEPIKIFREHIWFVNTVSFSPDGDTLVMGSADGTVSLWDTSSYKLLRRLTGYASSSINNISFSSNGQVLASHDLYYINLWDVGTGTILKTFKQMDTWFTGVSLSPNGQILASANLHETVSLWNVETGQQILRIGENEHNPGNMSVLFSPDGKSIVSNNGREIYHWDSNSGELISTLSGHHNIINSLAFSPNGQTLASGSMGVIAIWDVTTSEFIRSLTGVFSNMNSISFRPDGQTIAGSGWSEIGLWDVHTGELLKTLRDSGVTIDAISFSTDGQTLASSSRTNIRLWDVDAGTTYQTLTGHGHRVYSLSFSPDGGTLASGSEDGTVLLWETKPLILFPIADINSDGKVNIQDLIIVATQFGMTGQSAADINGDGLVNIQDLVLVASAFTEPASAPTMSSQVTNLLTISDVRQWLSQAQQTDLTDPNSQRGILVLEQLLAALTPKETVLLQNYPNPFNPETWIPYQLATPSHVRISIHAPDGRIVRTLNLGYHSSGSYQDRSRAAYWNGKNEFGESVASGVYFYTLITSEYSSTRQMLILK